jgi:regulator of PEP synthase PpsR (kinase-PPPase family)
VSEDLLYSNLESVPPIYIVSGGSGSCGEQLVDTILVQFPGVNVPVVKKSYVQHNEEIELIMNEVSGTNGIVLHTLVSKKLRQNIIKIGRQKKIATFDLMGPLFKHLTKTLQKNPVEYPGLYRKIHKHYFDRVEAIDFALKHDDGKNTSELHMADIIITGVSRTGKTPLSMYLAVSGWKVANVPIIRETLFPIELSQIDRKRVFGLDVDYEQLVEYRHKRQKNMGVESLSIYTDPHEVYKELEYALEIFRMHRFSIINVSNKPIESSANEIIELITRRFKEYST